MTLHDYIITKKKYYLLLVGVTGAIFFINGLINFYMKHELAPYNVALAALSIVFYFQIKKQTEEKAFELNFFIFLIFVLFYLFLSIFLTFGVDYVYYFRYMGWLSLSILALSKAKFIYLKIITILGFISTIGLLLFSFRVDYMPTYWLFVAEFFVSLLIILNMIRFLEIKAKE